MPIDPELSPVVVGAGFVSPIGLCLDEAAAAARARIGRMREIEWLDRRFQPFIAGRVPDIGLPPLAAEHAAALAAGMLGAREARMLRLAAAAIAEALSPLAETVIDPVGDVPLLLGLTEQHAGAPFDPAAFLERLDMQVPGRIELPACGAAAHGRAGGLNALREASARLVRGECEFILAGGVDSLVEQALLKQLDAEGRIRNEINTDGFRPSEGAAFLLLATQGAARSRGIEPWVRVLGAAQGFERGHLYADEPYLGEGLAATLADLFRGSAPPSPIESVFCSFNGERYWAREFGVARIRQSQAFVDEPRMEHPAECFGDLGAAHGAALAALAAHALRGGYRPAPALVYASSDRGLRAASLFAAAA